MNGKKAKMLRRMAQKHTVGLPDRNYVAENVRNRKNKHGDTVFKTGTAVLQDCTRATYKALKKAYKQGVR